MRYDAYDDRLYALEVVSPAGSLIADVTGITPSFSYGVRRNRPESIELSIDLGAAMVLARKLGLGIYELFAGYVNEIRIRRGNRYLLGGQIVYAEPSMTADGRQLTVRAQGFLAMFADRRLLPVVGADGGQTIVTAVDIGQVVWSMIQTTQALPNGDFGVTLGAIQTSRPITEQWKPYASTLQDIFQDLTERINSVDIAFSSDKKLWVFSPGIGSDKTELLMSLPGNITQISMPRDWSRLNNYSINRGGGNGVDATPIETRQHTPSQQVYKIRMRIDDFPQVTVAQTLRDFGDETLRIDNAGSTIPRVTLNGRIEPQLGAYWIGDRVRFDVDDEAFALLDGRSWRINDIQVRVDDNHDENIQLQVGYS